MKFTDADVFIPPIKSKAFSVCWHALILKINHVAADAMAANSARLSKNILTLPAAKRLRGCFRRYFLASPVFAPHCVGLQYPDVALPGNAVMRQRMLIICGISKSSDEPAPAPQSDIANRATGRDLT